MTKKVTLVNAPIILLMVRPKNIEFLSLFDCNIDIIFITFKLNGKLNFVLFVFSVCLSLQKKKPFHASTYVRTDQTYVEKNDFSSTLKNYGSGTSYKDKIRFIIMSKYIYLVLL